MPHLKNVRGSRDRGQLICGTDLAAESDRDFELGDFGNTARNDGDAMQARSVEQHAVNFIQGYGIDDVAGRERVGNGVTFGGHGEWYETRTCS